MRTHFIYISIFLLLLSCGKSEEQKKIDKEQALQLIQKADKLFFENNFNEALELYLNAEKLNYDNPVFYYKIGFCYYRGVDNIDRAEKYYLKALKKLKTEDNLQYLAAAYFNLGIIANLNKDIEKKSEYFNSAYSLLQKLLDKGQMRGEDFFRLAYYYYNRKEFENARKFFKLAIKSLKKENPNHFYYAGAYFNIGLTYWEEDDISTTLKYWKQTLKIEPDNEDYQTWYDRAREIKKSE